MKIVSFTLEISIYRAIGGTGNGKYVVDGTHSKDKCFTREKMNWFSKSPTKTCKVLGIIYSTSNK